MINEVKSRNELADLLGISRKRLTYLLYIKYLMRNPLGTGNSGFLSVPGGILNAQNIS